MKMYITQYKHYGKCGGLVRSGFTLIELMVVITIMGILILGGVAAYSDFNKKQRVRQAAEYLKTELRLAQKNADSSELSPSCVGDLYGYEMRRESATTFSVRAHCLGGYADTVTLDLINDVEFANNWSNFRFNTLSNGVSTTAVPPPINNIPVTIDLQISGDASYMAHIDISEMGAMYVWW